MISRESSRALTGAPGTGNSRAVRLLLRRIVPGLALLSSIAATALAQATLNMSEDLVRLGIASSNMLPNQPSQDSGPLFFRAVSYAQAHQIGAVIADPGAYYFLSLQYSGAHVGWNQLSNITIDLQGSDLYFSFPLVHGINITNSNNVVLQNFTADYNPLPFTQVRVVSVNPAQRQIQFAVDGAWQNPSVLNAVFAAGGSVEVHIFRNGRAIQQVPRMYAANPVGSNQFTVIYANPTAAMLALIRPGDTAFLGMRTGAGGPVTASYCNACTFRNIKVYSSVEWAVANFVSQSSVYERVYAMPRPGTDHLSSTYGTVELAGAKPGNQIRLSRMIGTMDNGSPLAADTIGTVSSQIDSRTLVLQGASTTLLQLGISPPNGSSVAFQRTSDGVNLGSAVIVSQGAPGLNSQGVNQVTYGFDRDLPSGLVGSAMQGLDPNLLATNSVIERNAIEKVTDCCRGFLALGLNNSVVHGNYIRGVPMNGLYVENALYSTQLSPPSTNLAITNNVIDRTNWTTTGFVLYQLGAIEVVTAESGGAPAPVAAHQNVTVTGNFIADSGTAAIWMGNTNGGSVTANYFLNPNSSPIVEATVAPYADTQPLMLQGSQNIVTANNTVDQTSGRIWITDGQYRELAAYAPGTNIRLSAFNLGTLSNPNVALTDADGSILPASIQAANGHAIDIQIPATAALGGAYVTVTSGSAKYFGTLFVDSVDNVPAANGCTYEISPSGSSVGASPDNVAFLVVTETGCSYQILATDSFVTAGPGASGTGVIYLGFAANPGASRATTIEIAGQPITLTQTNVAGSPASRFVPITPCRVVDTRNAAGPFGGPTLAANTSRDFAIPNGACNIPAGATAYSLSLAVVPSGPLGYVTLWPAGQRQPFVATETSLDGRIRANAAIVPAGSNGAVSVFATNTTDVILDINGYFVPVSSSTGLAFYPVTPCRVADTRNSTGPFGGPSLASGSTRTFPVAQSVCGLPSSAQAYALNFAAVPQSGLGYLTAWPTGQRQPLAASLTAPTGAITANAVLVPAGANGSVDVFSTDSTDLVIDITGYFAPSSSNGLSLYNISPCRVLDTRQLANGAPFSGTNSVNVTASGCGAPSSALAYVFNATVVPPAPLGYLTLWPQGQSQPLAATLNAVDGAITSNLALTPTHNGSVNAFVSNPTHLILDLFGYFAP